VIVEMFAWWIFLFCKLQLQESSSWRWFLFFCICNNKMFIHNEFFSANCDCKNAHFYFENSDCRNPPNAFNKNYLCRNIVLTTCLQNLETHVEWLWSNKRKGINRSKSNITMREEYKWKQTCIQGFEPNC
jgi:hypothetical protein